MLSKINKKAPGLYAGYPIIEFYMNFLKSCLRSDIQLVGYITEYFTV
jgi:hypothetical protein